jgi:hypothetical protein
MEFSKTFIDAAGRSWTVDLGVGSARRMKDIAGASLDDLVPAAPPDGKHLDKAVMNPLVAFLSDPFKVFDAFYTLVKPQADAMGLTKEQVEEGITPYQIDKDGVKTTVDPVELMAMAVLKAIHDFFRWDPARQATLRQIAKVGQQAMAAAAKKIDSALNKIDFGKLLDEAPELDAESLRASLADQLSKPASATRATWASTPTH